MKKFTNWILLNPSKITLKNNNQLPRVTMCIVNSKNNQIWGKNILKIKFKAIEINIKNGNPFKIDL